ncbi:hypothetical protein HYY74_00015 [Candidatus Woesearchaeota archaeon]|nr:hypothetical protein [Candidatus Woesearchaeota archaeon]
MKTKYMNALDWMSLHPKDVEKHSGKWVAVIDEGIVASADSLSEVSSKLNTKGIKLEEVMVMKVPRKDEEMSIL